MKRTLLAAEHENLGAKMVEFAGWYMPIQYSNLKEEHLAVRSHVGIFDVSHMGEIFFRGPKALEALQFLTTNDVAKLQNGQAQYSIIPNSTGGVVDDIIVYCIERDEEYLVCVNAANIEKDYAHFVKYNPNGAVIVNESDKWSQVAVQGPNALALIDKVMGIKAETIPSFHFQFVNFKGQKTILARTGYTGESGAEIFAPNAVIVDLWRAFMTEGKEFGILPIGLGARDTLRIEMKYSLYGHEIDDATNPFEAGLGWVIAVQKDNFLGKAAMLAAKEKGLKQKLVGLQMLDRGIPRDNYNVLSFDNKPIGRLTSGTHSPSLDAPVGIAYVQTEFSKVGSEVLIDIRGRMAKAKVVATPFVKK